MLPGAKKDSQLITRDWHKLEELIEGVSLHEVLHVPRDHGVITELFRPEWDTGGLPVAQIYQSRLFQGALGAWSCHARNTDRLFVNSGHVKIVLYDARPDSKTSGKVNEFHTGDMRPSLLVIPPGIWHGLQNLGSSEALVLNFPTRAYDYEDPDHYRLPCDTSEIPYSWPSSGHLVRHRSSRN
jgi:dTDP-4-dehydrorhamnose 3,5-epimerase